MGRGGHPRDGLVKREGRSRLLAVPCMPLLISLLAPTGRLKVLGHASDCTPEASPQRVIRRNSNRSVSHRETDRCHLRATVLLHPLPLPEHAERARRRHERSNPSITPPVPSHAHLPCPVAHPRAHIRNPSSLPSFDVNESHSRH